MDNQETQDPLAYLGLLECRAEMDKKEIKETRAVLVFRERLD